jgi:hypothetical protein
VVPSTGARFPSSVPVEENLALARIAERVTKLRRLKVDDLSWMAGAVGVSATVPQGFVEAVGRLLGTSKGNSPLSKADVLTYLLSAYRGSTERFPRLLELLFQHALVSFFPRRGNGSVRISPTIVRDRAAEFEKNRRAFAACASVLGFGLTVEIDSKGLDPVQVRPRRQDAGEPQRAERGRLHHMLEKDFPEELKKLLGAYERYTSGGPDAYRGAVESCRSAFEFFFRKLTVSAKWSEKLTTVFRSATLCSFFKQTYAFLSCAGTHSEANRQRVEAFLAIRVTEDVMVCALTWVERWGRGDSAESLIEQPRTSTPEPSG